MRFTKKLSYEHKAKKNQSGEKDIIDKFDVIDILKNQFGLIGLTGEVITIPGKYYHRMPDIVIKEHDIAIELDGEIHGSGDEISKRDGEDGRVSDQVLPKIADTRQATFRGNRLRRENL